VVTENVSEAESAPALPVDAARARAHAQRVLASETFSKAHSLRRLLAYVVDETLGGRADGL
jgi:hypothetical protein